jgi:alpha-D-ribose 1-methylphosphonate 5-triphosphate diphosphatase
VRVVSRGPALAAGLEDRGAIAPGQLGDLLRVAVLDGHPVVRQAWIGGERIA